MANKLSSDAKTLILKGLDVLAKTYNGEIVPVTYANRTQAKKKVMELGPKWRVYKGIGRPFYVVKNLVKENGVDVSTK